MMVLITAYRDTFLPATFVLQYLSTKTLIMEVYVHENSGEGIFYMGPPEAFSIIPLRRLSADK